MNGYDVHNTNIDLIFSGIPRFFVTISWGSKESSVCFFLAGQAFVWEFWERAPEWILA